VPAQGTVLRSVACLNLSRLEKVEDCPYKLLVGYSRNKKETKWSLFFFKKNCAVALQKIHTLTMQSSPLLPGAPRPRRASRTAAAVIAGVCAVGAIAAVAVIVQGGGPAALLQKAPVYYIKQARAGGVQPPVVYYYLPNEAKADAHPAAQHATAAQTLLAANDTASTKLVCTVDKIKAMSALVQTQWDACKTNPGYVQPNKDAKRRLLGWVWEPEAAGEKKTAKPKHGPEHYHLKLSETDRRFAMHSKLHTEMNVKHKAPAHAMQVLAENATGATGATGSVSFNDCQKKATEEACAAIAGCKNPVCESYYNEPEIEALCGMCTMAPLGCFANSAEVSSYSCHSPFADESLREWERERVHAHSEPPCFIFWGSTGVMLAGSNSIAACWRRCTSRTRVR
jgi:hypothetical protein